MILEVLLLLFVLLLGVSLWPRINLKKDQAQILPGPTGLPMFGSVLSFLITTPYKKLYNWANTYGNIFSLTILTKKIVVVSCPKLLREIFEHPSSTGKYDIEPVLALTQGRYGVTSTDGKLWSEQRKFNIKTLHHLGMGISSVIETLIMSEVTLAVSWVRKESRDNRPVKPINFIKVINSNILWRLIRGDRQDYISQKANKVTTDFISAFNSTVKRGFVLFPWLKWVASWLLGYTYLLNCSKNLHNIIEHLIIERQDERIGSFDEVKEPRDMLDAYVDHLEQIKKDDNTDSTFYGELGWKNTKAVMVETFTSGGESTTHTMNWLVFFLSCHQKIQEKLQKEIDEVIGMRRPNLTDKSSMPYTEAVILETFRKAPVFPFTTPHKLTDDLNLTKGYRIPAGALLIANIYHTHMNKKFWGDPEVFRPERFISGEDGNDIHTISERKEAVVPFNVGKRTCLGQHLAEDIVFLFVVKFFQTFKVSVCSENKVTDFKSSGPLLLTAKPYQVEVQERNK